MVGLLAGVSWAEYPDRPITLIGIWGAGGSSDMSSRALVIFAEKKLGQPFVITYKPGAAGSLGVGAVAAAKPDGYTIGAVTFSPLTTSPHMFDVPYNPLTDFQYIMGYGKYMYGACVRADSPFKTLKDLIDYAKANPGKIKYSHAGNATPNNFGMIYLAKATGVKWEGIVYKTAPEYTAACLGGHVDVVSPNPIDVVQYIKAGRLRLLVSFCDNRWEWVPEVPTALELGYNINLVSWYALGAPKGVPKPIMEKLRTVFTEAVKDAEFLEIMKRFYAPVVFRTGDEFKKLVEEGYRENEKMIFELGLHKSQKK
jgi:tripartite-type tricarboxylate transporter receptor subunit TctC